MLSGGNQNTLSYQELVDFVIAELPSLKIVEKHLLPKRISHFQQYILEENVTPLSNLIA
jgi:hypothetical protein